MAKHLVIVESPAKARTIAGYLGNDYAVESSVGHVRDLPNRASDVPAEQRKRFGALGVDVDKGFEPYYVVDPGKKKIVTELKKHLADADELLLATDEDREGEAIAWHLVQVLKPKVPVRRMVFHEITKDAIARAAAETRDIDDRLVDAQETRRILDRLYGYEVSPVLWKKVTRGLSAGRVQSVATRLVVQRERERMAFRSAEYWDLKATFDPGTFEARLVAIDGARVAQGRDFAPTGELAETGSVVLDEEAAMGLAARLAESEFSVRAVDERPYRRKPAAPFRTATLQQEASRKLRFSAQTTMRVAQKLYEAGYITYMRTDSTTLSESAVHAARAQVRELFGDDHVPEKPRHYGRAVANAQEAHEAIRPAGDVFRTPKELAGELGRDELALYDLVWKRTLASQMEDARGQTVSLRIAASSSAGEDAEFGASGTVITFRGFLAAYEPGRDEPTADDDEERVLPQLSVGQRVELRSLEPDGHATQPPARYTEPTLVRALEERGIGRPSTYAAILSTIVDRGYVFKRGTALVPTFTAFAVVNLLERHFEQLVDFDFTKRMEDDLDRIAAGEQERVAWLTRFYFGDDGDPGLHHLVTDHLDEIDARAVNSIEIPGSEAVVRVGRYGPYVERGEQRVSLPADLAPDELTPARVEELLAQPDVRPLGVDPETGREIVVRSGRYGPYVTEVLPEGSEEKPRTASLFSTMSPEEVALDDALRLLSLPRVVGALDGEEVTAQNGRYGPYIKRGTESRSLESEEQLFTVTLDQAKALLAEPPRRRGRRGAARGPLKELGTDSSTGKPVVVKDGRFGPYVTDGQTNASLRRGDTPESITLERASELLAERRAKSE
ncbi:MAG TPA: type I DNA topoisomerase [Gaiellaceae bacterium]|nr:type I DNA topoisomerase [Gaiellaceae bacterium]